MSRARKILIALDQLVNALAGGWPDETLSSRCWRWDVAGKRSWPRKAVDQLFGLLGDKDHCRASYENERRGMQLPPELRRDI